MKIVQSNVDTETTYEFTQKHFVISRNGDRLHCRYVEMENFATHFDKDIKAEIMGLYNERYPIKKCVICGKEFRTMREMVVTCGDSDCKYKRKRFMQNEINKPEKTRVCIVCGRTFEAVHGRELSCSPECRDKHRKKRNAEYNKEKRISDKARKSMTKNESLEEKIALAASMGITYGQLQTLQTCERLKGEGNGIL